MQNPRKWRSPAGIWLVLTCLFAPPASAQIHFYLEDEPIYTSSSAQSPGFLMEVVNSMVKRLKINPKITFLPWNRAQLMTINTPNAVIFPLSRTQEREDNYRWICKVMEVPVMFITKEGFQIINSVEEARALRGIGVIIGTPQEAFLNHQGLPYVSLTGQELYEALHSDKVSAVFTALPEAVYGWKQAGYNGKLNFGTTLQTLPLWIAANKHSDEVDDAAWQQALESIRTSGEFDRLMAQYFGR